jgi:hypothetical protein
VVAVACDVAPEATGEATATTARRRIHLRVRVAATTAVMASCRIHLHLRRMATAATAAMARRVHSVVVRGVACVATATTASPSMMTPETGHGGLSFC